MWRHARVYLPPPLEALPELGPEAGEARHLRASPTKGGDRRAARSHGFYTLNVAGLLPMLLPIQCRLGTLLSDFAPTIRQQILDTTDGPS
jgi:hypothetical protein